MGDYKRPRTYISKVAADAEYWLPRTQSGPDERKYLRAFVDWIAANRDLPPGESQARFELVGEQKDGER